MADYGASLAIAERTTNPDTPQSGYVRIFVKDDKSPYLKDDTGTVTKIALADDAPAPHADTHKHGGTDEVAVSSPAANAIPKANGDGVLDDWISPASETVSGIVELATGTETDAGKAIQANDPRIPTQDENDALTGTGTPASGNPFVTQDTFDDHSARHEAGGADEIAVAPSLLTSAVPLDKGGTGVDLSGSGGATQFLAQNASHVISARALTPADVPAASSSGQGAVPTTSGESDGDKLRVKSDLTLEWYTPSLDDEKVSKIYDTSGSSVVAATNASGGLDVGSPATSAGADDLAVGGDVAVEGAVQGNDGSDLLYRSSGIANPDLHFSTYDITGWTWDTTDFDGVPPLAQVDTTSYLVLGGASGPESYFLYKNVSGASNYYAAYARVAMAASVTRIGVRLDDGTDNNYLEVYIETGTTKGYKFTRKTRDGGGSPVINSYWDNTLPAFYTISAFKYTSTAVYTRLVLEGGVLYTIDDSSTTSWTAARVGLIFSSSSTFTAGRGLCDWIRLSQS